MFLKKKTSYIEAYTKEVLANTQESIVYTDEKLAIKDANKAFFALIGVDSLEVFQNYYKTLRELVFWEKEAEIKNPAVWLEMLTGLHKPYHMSLKVGKDVVHVDTRVVKLSSKEYLFFLQNTTQLYDIKKKEAEVDELKSSFLANISHEFRTPMNGILGFLELFYYTELSSEQKKYLQMINRSSQVLLSNIEALLDYSQLQSRQLQTHNNFFNICETAEKIAKNYALLAKESTKRLYVYIDPQLPKEINSDRRKIKQILTALLDNAMKFTKKHGVIVLEIKHLLQKSKTDQSVLSFAVYDNGIGIEQEKIKKLLKPFSSEGKADQRLGIGLSLANGLVELLGSKLTIDSKTNQGTKVSFSLQVSSLKTPQYPILQPKNAHIVLTTQAPTSMQITKAYLQAFGLRVQKYTGLSPDVFKDADIVIIVAQTLNTIDRTIIKNNKNIPVVALVKEGETKSDSLFDEIVYEPLLPSAVYKFLTRKKQQEDIHVQHNTKAAQRVLVAEDNLINQKLLKKLLEDKHLKVDVANDGIEAVDMAMHNEYDIIFMDIDMPGKNGIEATKEIKSTSILNKNTPVIAQTAMAMDGDRERLLQEGLDDYIPKPLRRELLENILRTYGGI